jgi:hypothetical protein
LRQSNIGAYLINNAENKILEICTNTCGQRKSGGLENPLGPKKIRRIEKSLRPEKIRRIGKSLRPEKIRPIEKSFVDTYT